MNTDKHKLCEYIKRAELPFQAKVSRQEEITVAHAISIALETWKLRPVDGYPQATSQRVEGRVFETPRLH